jgi:hypothetical protein
MTTATNGVVTDALNDKKAEKLQKV